MCFKMSNFRRVAKNISKMNLLPKNYLLFKFYNQITKIIVYKSTLSNGKLIINNFAYA